MNLKIKKLGSYDFCANYFYARHTHADYEINYVTSGNCMMTIKNKNIALHKGECIVIEPGFSHSFIVNAAKSCQITQFEFCVDNSIGVIKNPDCIKLVNCRDIRESIGNLYSYYRDMNSAPSYYKLFVLELEKLFILISMHMEKAEDSRQPYTVSPLNHILCYLDTHFDQPVDLDWLAKQNKISTRYLRKIFARHMGVSAIDYITMLRIEKAKDLLKNSRLSIAHVAASAGYSSQPYFSAMFKKKTGISPRDFRRQYHL